MGFREEKDSLGVVMVPDSAHYGAQTQRAVENFTIGNLTLQESFIHALALIKKCAAIVNLKLGLLKDDTAKAIISAASRVMDGDTMAGGVYQFPVNVFQTGSGTSSNMNMNEVLASMANESLTGKKGGKSPVHPNDHVNLGQSSNDVFPTALHISVLTGVRKKAIPALSELETALTQKSVQFGDIYKIGRTHLQDAVPMKLGDEFSGYARQIALAGERLISGGEGLLELALGGTAVGTGLNAHPLFAREVISLISAETDLPFKEASNHFEAQGAQDSAVFMSGAFKSAAVSMIKIANDIRLLASGPRCGLGEIILPSLQPGSSIMPGKVNPVIPEAVIQAGAQVIGNDAAVTAGGQWGFFELNTMLPLIAYNLLFSVELISSAARSFCRKCITGITADRGVCEGYIEKSLALVTGLTPLIGYDKAAYVAKKAYESGKTIRETVLEENLLKEKELDELLRPDR